MTDDEPEIPAVEGDEAPPDVEIHPVDAEDAGGEDEEMSDPQNLPPESFHADVEDTDGVADTWEGGTADPDTPEPGDG